MNTTNNSLPFIVGLCGRTCSGKTTLSRNLAANNPEKVLVIECDKFERANSKQKYNGFENVDHPDSIKFKKLIKSIKLLKKGKKVKIPKGRGEKKHDLSLIPKDIIIVEGFLLFLEKELLDLFDKKIFIDISDETLISRRLLRKRHPKYDGIEYLENVALPFSKKFETIQKSNAELILNGEEDKEKLAQLIYQELPKIP